MITPSGNSLNLTYCKDRRQALRERLHDNRFLRLIAGLLEAGYMEDWQFNATLSGTPQGGVVSPILANIYLDQLDRARRNSAPTGKHAWSPAEEKQNVPKLVETGQVLGTPKGNSNERQSCGESCRPCRPLTPVHPNYRRLRYVRYADDFLLGFSGPRREADEVKRQIGEFLRDRLKLEMSETKTLVTHGRTGAARFLGYEVGVMHSDQNATSGVAAQLTA